LMATATLLLAWLMFRLRLDMGALGQC